LPRFDHRRVLAGQDEIGYAEAMPDTIQHGPPFTVTLDGASNLRDLGGYRTADGRVVRRGLVYRSAALAKLTEADLAVIAGLGLRSICDFRGRQESLRAPTLVRGVPIHALSIEPTVGAGLRDILATKEATGEALFAVLERAYAAYALSSSAQYRAMLDLVLDGGTPLLFHCSAGKDRTGFGAAILLTALGVPWDTVVADFQATNQLWRRDTVHSDDLPLLVRESLLRADPLLLTAAFDAARAQYGSLDTYLAEALGFGPTRRAQLQDLLLEDA
jgi:protein-tyrosine phosphatase